MKISFTELIKFQNYAFYHDFALVSTHCQSYRRLQSLVPCDSFLEFGTQHRDSKNTGSACKRREPQGRQQNTSSVFAVKSCKGHGVSKTQAFPHHSRAETAAETAKHRLCLFAPTKKVRQPHSTDSPNHGICPQHARGRSYAEETE